MTWIPMEFTDLYFSLIKIFYCVDRAVPWARADQEYPKINTLSVGVDCDGVY